MDATGADKKSQSDKLYQEINTQKQYLKRRLISRDVFNNTRISTPTIRLHLETIDEDVIRSRRILALKYRELVTLHQQQRRCTRDGWCFTSTCKHCSTILKFGVVTTTQDGEIIEKDEDSDNYSDEEKDELELEKNAPLVIPSLEEIEEEGNCKVYFYEKRPKKQVRFTEPLEIQTSGLDCEMDEFNARLLRKIRNEKNAPLEIPEMIKLNDGEQHNGEDL